MSVRGENVMAAARAAVLPTYARADVTIVRGEACRVWDDEGRSYLDFGGGIAVVGLGHRHPVVTAAAHAQLDELWHASNLYWTEPMLRLATLLSERVGGAQAFFCNSGAEANEAALKVARKATGRSRIVALEGGSTAGRSEHCPRRGSPANGRGSARSSPASPSPGRTTWSRSRLRSSPGGELAIIILEPVLGEGGVVPLDEGFVRVASELAHELGALLCVDEVQSGLGRTGTFFAYEQLGIEPDLVTLAKGLGNGLPIGALLVRDGIADAIRPGDHGSTFGGNPVACAAACAVVEAIDHALLANVAARGEELAAGLRELPGVLEVRGRGLLLAAVVDGDAGAVVDACRERGLLALTAGADVLRLLPPLVVTEAEVGEALGILADALV